MRLVGRVGGTKGAAALVEALKGWCQAYLKPGEQVRQVIGVAVGAEPRVVWEFLLFDWLAFAFHQKQHRLLCVTDQTIVVMDADRHWAPKHVITVLPRNIEFGPMSPHRWSPLWGLGGGLFVHQMFRDEVADADADLTSAL